MDVTYSDIILAEEPESGLGLSYSDILYPDIAHQRFPEVPLYLQQDYGVTRYGNYPLRTYGCGITSLAMLSSYMTDTELTPPILCERYGSYCSEWGTDYTIFRREPPNMGYYLRDQVFDPDVALAALEDGYPLILLSDERLLDLQGALHRGRKDRREWCPGPGLQYLQLPPCTGPHHRPTHLGRREGCQRLLLDL